MDKAFLIGLLPILAWGASDYLVGKSSKRFSPLTALFSITVIGFVVACFIMLLAPGDGIFNNHNESLWVLAISSFMTIAYLALTTALDIGPISVASTTANAYPLVTALLVIAFGASLVINVIVGALVVFIGGALLSAEASHAGHVFFKSRAFRIASIAVLSWGVAFYLFGEVVSQLSWSEVNVLVNFTIATQCALIMMIQKVGIQSSLQILSESKSWPMWLAGSLQSVGLATFFLAQDAGDNIVVPAIMASASPLVTVALARYFDKEALLKLNYVGAAVIVFGIMIINSVEL